VITVTVHGVEQVAQRLQDVPKNLAHGVILEMSQVVFDHMQAGADRHTKTGALFQSVYNRAIPGGREVGHDQDRAPHALFVVWGAKPHKIKPLNKKSLRWSGPGGFIFARFANHPGYKGDNYMQRAADEAIRRMPEIVARHTKKETV